MFLEKIRPMVAEKFGVDESSVTADTRIIEDLGADSLDIVDMLTMIEDDMGITIPDDVAQELKTLGDVSDYLENASK